MAVRKKSEKQINTHLAININKYDFSIGASINYEVRDPRRCRDDARIYKFETRLGIEGMCTYPVSRKGEMYQIDLNGSLLHDGDLTLRLVDCIKRDEHGEIIERKIRGKLLPIYEPPDCIGLMERQRGEKRWTGWAWVSPQTVTDMLTVLPNHQPIYLELHEIQIGRKHGAVINFVYEA